VTAGNTPPEPGDRPRRAPAITAAGTLTGWLGTIRVRQADGEARDAIRELVPHGHGLGEFVLRFSALTVLSAAIAAFGLLADSGAVVIGAMLVAPLMTPILAAAAATVTADNRLLVRSVAIIALGTVLAVAVGWIVGAIAAVHVIDVGALPDEIRSRTFPGLLDLGIAISAGAAAGYIQPRRSAISALPGVGIAVALVPPLAAVGLTAQLGLGSEARNAFLLYLTNLAAIVFSAGIVLLLTGFRPRPEAGRRALRTRLAVTLAAVAVVAVPLYLHTRSAVADLRLERTVVDAVDDWDDSVRIVDVSASVDGDVADVDLVVVGRGSAPPTWALADAIRDRFGGPVELRVFYQRDERFSVSAR
jgi:uncharacterized hydrophobic protein (TIGR00271 family)